MDRNEDQESVNPGMVERQLDETPVEREDMAGSSGGVERENLSDGGGSTERENMSDGGGSVERESASGGGDVERDSMSAGGDATGAVNDAQMRASGREGGYGYDRPVDLTPTRDTLERPARGDTGEQTRGTDTTRGRGDFNNMGRDW